MRRNGDNRYLRKSAEIALRVMRRNPGLYVALETFPLGGKRLSGVRAVQTTALNMLSSVGKTECSFHRKAFSVTCFIVEFLSSGTRLISEPDFVSWTISTLFTIRRGTGRSSNVVIKKQC